MCWRYLDWEDLWMRTSSACRAQFTVRVSDAKWVLDGRGWNQTSASDFWVWGGVEWERYSCCVPLSYALRAWQIRATWVTRIECTCIRRFSSPSTERHLWSRIEKKSSAFEPDGRLLRFWETWHQYSMWHCQGSFHEMTFLLCITTVAYAMNTETIAPFFISGFNLIVSFILYICIILRINFNIKLSHNFLSFIFTLPSQPSPSKCKGWYK